MIYSGNDDYLCIDGVDLSAYWRDVTFTLMSESVDVTAGIVAWREVVETIRQYTLTIAALYSQPNIAAILRVMEPGEHYVIYGSEGREAGKPRHEGLFLFQQGDMAASYNLQGRVIRVQGVSTGAPIYDMYKDRW